MQNLFYTLKVERHLKYKGRLQLSLFLKSIGLPLQEALYFWKSMLLSMTLNDKFDKEYTYNLRHIYGREGSKKSYFSHDCIKVIMQLPGPLETCGCPFRFADKQKLITKLKTLNIMDSAAAKIIDKAGSN